MISKMTVRAFLGAALLIGTSSVPALSRGHAKAATPVVAGQYVEKSTGNTLDVEQLPDGKIKIDLAAYWPSEKPSAADFPSGPNIGETKATIPIKNGIAVYSTTEFGASCKITFKFASDSVDVKQDGDPNHCGYGMNVIATGTYAKVGKGPAPAKPKKRHGR